MPVLHPDDEIELEWYFSGTNLSFERSTMGTMLEMQAARYRDSAGKRVPAPEDRWLCIALHETRCEPSYEPDLESIFRLAWVSRRLDAIARACPIARQALEAYYGPSGQFWKTISRRQEWALVGLTRTGAAYFRARKQRAETCGTPLTSGPSFELAADAELQALNPSPERAGRLHAVADEIDALLSVMCSSWQSTDPERRPIHDRA